MGVFTMAVTFKSIGQRLRSWFTARQQRPLRKQARRCRLQLEVLEERATPSANPVTAIGDVFYIDMENHNFTQPNGNVNTSSSTIEQIQGNPAAPFINSLITPGDPNAAMTSYATNYHNVLATPSGSNPSIHPSEPNYIWQEGGSNFGVLNDADPYANNGLPSGNNVNLIAQTNGGTDPASLSALLQAQYGTAGWHTYQEDMQYDGLSVPTVGVSGTNGAVNPYNGSTQYNFAPKHDGTLFFTATNGDTLTGPGPSDSTNPEAAYYSPLGQLATDLANNTVARYNLITPNQFNDMHTALTGGFTYNGVHYTGDAANIAQGDNFLSKIIPVIENSAAFKNNGEIVIWNDETEAQNSSDHTQNDFSHTMLEIVISPLAKGNAYASTLDYTHSSDLKTLQETFGVQAPGGGFLGDANTPGTNDLSDMFVPGVFTPSTLGGTVVKNSGNDHKVEAGLTIVLTGTNDANQVVYLTTTTAADGSYTFTGLLPGTYNVTVPGAKKDPGISGIKLGVGQTLGDLDFSLLGPNSKQ
jgi:phosphatidylinositol-3-phosphatase